MGAPSTERSTTISTELGDLLAREKTAATSPATQVAPAVPAAPAHSNGVTGPVPLLP